MQRGESGAAGVAVGVIWGVPLCEDRGVRSGELKRLGRCLKSLLYNLGTLALATIAHCDWHSSGTTAHTQHVRIRKRLTAGR